MLKFENVGFNYSQGKSTIIKDVSFEVTNGEFVVLLGENGAGKSTICRLANGLLKPLTGKVFVAGDDTASVKISKIARNVGFLFQNPDRQLCSNTIRDEIRFGLEAALDKNLSPAEIEAEKNRRCDEMLELFKLDGKRDPYGLSRGERQQCALATVLARQPQLLILDEPTTGLDYRECVTIMEVIIKLNSASSGISSKASNSGTTVFMITHDMEVAADFSRRALVLSNGMLIGDGPTREILKDKTLLDRASLLPPQIVSLVMRCAPFAKERLGNVFSLGEMIDALTSSRKIDSSSEQKGVSA